MEALPEDAVELPEDVSPTKISSFSDSLKSLLRNSLLSATQALSEGMRLCVLLLIIALFGSLCIKNTLQIDLRLIIGVLGMFGAVAGSMHSMIRLAQSTIAQLKDYGSILLPVLSSAMALSGAPATAAGLHGVTVLFSRILMGTMTKYLFPCIYFYLALGAAECAIDRSLFGELRELLGWMVEKSLRIILYTFTGFLSLTGVISGKTDALTLKATKAAISGMVPVVGSILSDASETMLAGAGLVKHSAGLFSLLAILSITLLPFFRIGLQYLLMKLTAACAGAIGLPAHVAYLKLIASAMGYVLAMTGICALLLLVSAICYVQVISI